MITLACGPCLSCSPSPDYHQVTRVGYGEEAAVQSERNWEKPWFPEPREGSASGKKGQAALPDAMGGNHSGSDTTSNKENREGE